MEVKRGRKRKRTSSEIYLKAVRHFAGKNFTMQDLKSYSTKKFGIDISTRLPQMNRLSRFKSLPKKKRKIVSLKPVIRLPVKTKVKKQPGPFCVKIKRCGSKSSAESYCSSSQSQIFGKLGIPHWYEQQIFGQRIPTQRETDRYFDRKIGHDRSRAHREEVDRDSLDNLLSCTVVEKHQCVKNITRQAVLGTRDIKNSSLSSDWIEDMTTRTVPTGHSLPTDFPEVDNPRMTPAFLVNREWNGLTGGLETCGDCDCWNQRATDAARAGAGMASPTRDTCQSRVKTSGRRRQQQEGEKGHDRRSGANESNTVNWQNGRPNLWVHRGSVRVETRRTDDSFGEIHVPCTDEVNSSWLQKVREESRRIRSLRLLNNRDREYVGRTLAPSHVDDVRNQDALHSSSELVVPLKSKSGRVQRGLRDATGNNMRDVRDPFRIRPSSSSDKEKWNLNRVTSKNICTQTSDSHFSPEESPHHELPSNVQMAEDV